MNEALILLPPQTGTAFYLDRGQTLRVVDVEGTQVSDLVFSTVTICAKKSVRARRSTSRKRY